MLDIETAHKLASFLETKFSFKNTTEIPRPVHGPLQKVHAVRRNHLSQCITALKGIFFDAHYSSRQFDKLELVTTLPHRSSGPAATTRPPSPPEGSVYCACHEIWSKVSGVR